eukprot:gene15900-21563_t
MKSASINRSKQRQIQHQSLRLDFRFVVFNSSSFTLELWEESLNNLCNDKRTQSCCTIEPISTTFQSQLWSHSSKLSSYLTDKIFDKEIIFVRFYLPLIFPDLNRFIYLDNDVIVTDDLQDLFHYSLFKTNFLLDNFEHLINDKNDNSGIIRNRPSSHTYNVHVYDKNIMVPIGFVFEKHSFYKSYKQNHLNQSHEMVQNANKFYTLDTFLNGGVILYDAKLWRKRNLTERAEAIIFSNRVNNNHTNEFNIYSHSIGDQGLFYTLLGGMMTALPAKYNMRRQPKKTIHMLENEMTLGILHFAGMIGGDAELLCRYPLQYPILLSAALPLFLSSVHSFINSCQSNTTIPSYL